MGVGIDHRVGLSQAMTAIAHETDRMTDRMAAALGMMAARALPGEHCRLDVDGHAGHDGPA